MYINFREGEGGGEPDSLEKMPGLRLRSTQNVCPQK